ncbi:type II secretion system F family protein [Raoultibacter phocaeensis]|uniref:type II secretion system F family protein n=1 Tax=Raoultibacter phocaeensis TaxID=2479841 RepID=UPI0011190651|nr:type II secretion system F family protein [Raoultibacter phocaeensis]
MEQLVIAHALACLGAAGAGCAATVHLCMRSGEKKRRLQAKDAVGKPVFERIGKLGCTGLTARIIHLTVRESIKPSFSLAAVSKRESAQGATGSSLEEAVLKAGLRDAVTRCGYDSARVCLALGCLCAGSMLGAVFSLELACLLGVGGAVAGWFSVRRALRKEAQVRKEKLGSQLGEMAEVVALGLRSGLSFDRAFALYCDHFESGFALDCSEALRKWSLGLVSREEALRSLAQTYDSAVLSRVVESVIRSLRFGSSLAETLESTAVESRSIHKAEVEERVAKAPIKMLVPVGALILPAMLIFVLGPIMIDLMKGM